MLKLWRKWGERPVRAPKPPPTFQDRRKFWRIMLGLTCFWQLAISALILVLRVRMGGLVSSYGLFFCLAFVRFPAEDSSSLFFTKILRSLPPLDFTLPQLAIGLFAAFIAYMPKLTFMYGHALISLFVGLGYILTIVIVYGTTASSTTADLNGLLIASFAVYLPAAVALTLGGVASFLAWRKTRQIDFEEFAAAQFAYGPAPNDANAGAAPQPQGQANAHALADSSEDSDAESRLEHRPAAGAGQGSDSDETRCIDESVANMDAASSVSGSETGQCCVCMSKPRNAVIYKCGHIAVCFDCGQTLLNTGQKCPICRQKIVDVIKGYKV